jgi:uncharacterized membrane protein SirB2
LIEFYTDIRLVHIGSVIASGSLFALRGALTLAGSTLPQSPAIRYLSYTIDTVLLTAALMLLSILHLNPLTTPWLATKLALLLLYIALGSFALKRGRTRRMRAVFLALAILALLSMVTIARAKDPLAPMRLLTDHVALRAIDADAPHK